MKPLSLQLGVVRASSTGRGHAISGPPPKIPADVKKKILERDDHTCASCGFRAQKYQEIHALNQDPTDLREENLVTTCIFCHQCFDLEAVGNMRSGVLLWLPEIKQADLHHIARAIYIARISQGPVAETARSMLDLLMTRREALKDRLQTDDPAILATVLRDYLGKRHYDNRIEKLEGIRLFPLDRRMVKEADLEFNQFPQILAYWRSKAGPFGGKPPAEWINLYHDILRSNGTQAA